MKLRTVIAVLISAALLLFGCTEKEKTEDTAVIRTEHCAVSDAMLEYIFYSNIYDLYANEADYYQLDLSASLAEQLYSEGVSWYEHLSRLAVSDAGGDVLLREAGLAAGFEYEPDIDSVIAEQTETARGQGMTLEEYYKSYYTDKVTEETVRELLSIQMYALAYRGVLEEEYARTLTDSDYAEFYEKNKMAIEIVDILTYSIPINYNGVINTEKLNSFLDCKSEEEFRACIAADLTEKNGRSASPLSPGELENRIAEKSGVVMSHYTPGGEFSEWAFAEDTQTGDTHYTEKNTGMYEIYMLLRRPYAQEKYTHDLGTILITSESCPTEAEAVQRADGIMADFHTEGGTEEAFEKLWESYGENDECFLYNTADTFFETDESAEWLRDTRKVGDITSFMTNNGYYVVYYKGRGQQRWVAEATADMCEDYLDTYLHELENSYGDSLKIREDVYDILPDSMPSAS